MSNPSLFMVLIGATPIGRHTEQHDVFFGIANTLADLKPAMENFWPEAVGHMHVDAYRAVQNANNYEIKIVPHKSKLKSDAQLFFINLGGYKQNEFDEFHYKIIIAATTKSEAIKLSKETAFYKHTGFKGASSHIDDKYGIDVDDVHAIDDILDPASKSAYKIVLKKTKMLVVDEMKLGYFKWTKL
jgi:hypothetical protein